MPIPQENYTVEFLIKVVKESNVKAVEDWLVLNREKQAQSQGYDLTKSYGRGLSEEPILFTAIRQKNLEIFSLLVEENKENLSKLRGRSGENLLHLIVLNGWNQGLKYLVDNCKDFISEPDFFNTGSPIFVHLINQLISSDKKNDALEMLDLLLRLDKIKLLLNKFASKLIFEKIDDEELKKIIAKKITSYFSISPYCDCVYNSEKLSNGSHSDVKGSVALFKAEPFVTKSKQEEISSEAVQQKEIDSSINILNNNTFGYLKSTLFNVSTFFVTQPKRRKPHKFEEENSLEQPLMSHVGKKQI